MTLKKQILFELRQQNKIAQEAIKELEDRISAEAFAMSTVTDGAFSGGVRSACQNRMQVASNEKQRINQQKEWINEMLSTYGTL